MNFNFKSLFNQRTKPKADMFWRSVVYSNQYGTVWFQIEPMFKEPDIVYFPTDETWNKNAPDWAKPLRNEIIKYLMGLSWKRELNWVESSSTSFHEGFPPIYAGTIESTRGGMKLSKMKVFNPNKNITASQTREIWQTASKRFAQEALGKVTIHADIDNSAGTVFYEIELKTLKENPNVELVIINDKIQH